MLSHRHARITRVARQILPTREDDEAVRVRVSMSGRKSPIRKLPQLRRSMMPFAWTTLKGQSNSVFRPITTPEDDLMIAEVIRRWLTIDAYRLDVIVVPNKRPEIFSVDLLEILQPFGHALRFSAVESLR